MGNTNLYNILIGEINDDLIVENVVLAKDSSNHYFAYEKQAPAIVVPVLPTPSRPVEFNDTLIEHYGRHSISVDLIEGASRNGTLYVSEANKKVNDVEFTLVSLRNRAALKAR